MRVLVIGGAGYIGSHAVRLLERDGYDVWVYDNLSYGHRAAARSDRFVEGDLADRALLESTLRSERIEAVMHFAARASVPESVRDPAKYYQNNVSATLGLLEAMRAAGVWRMVFSSSCATYGVPERLPITEDTPQRPINPYGFTKLVIEHALADYAHAYGFGSAALRYFNAAGASPDGDIGEDHTPETHIIPIVLQVALGQRESVTICGNDYPTPDGTCVRDYVHVDDIGTAHIRALERLEQGRAIELNLGTGRGHSVRQVVDTCQRITGRKIKAEYGPRRPGDPPELVADGSRARKVLDWVPRYPGLEEIVATAWHWHEAHPAGYAKPSHS